MGSWATGREGEAPGVGQGQKSGTEVCHWTMAHLDIPWEKQMPDVAFYKLQLQPGDTAYATKTQFALTRL